MKAITTTYKGPTDTRGSRIYARAESVRCSVPYDHALNADGNHDAAAVELCKRLDWRGKLAGGTLPDGRTRVYVFVTSDAIEVK